mgnify:CR=1 FL=1
MANPYNSGDMSGATVPDISTQGGASSYSGYASAISTLSVLLVDFKKLKHSRHN